MQTRPSAFAEVSIPPAKARQLLAHLPGMRARPDQHKEELGWTYVAPYDVLRHSSSDAPHDLAYYVYGTAEHVREMQLALSVYLKHPREAKTALTTLGQGCR